MLQDAFEHVWRCQYRRRWLDTLGLQDLVYNHDSVETMLTADGGSEMLLQCGHLGTVSETHPSCDPSQSVEISSSIEIVAWTAMRRCTDQRLHDVGCDLLGVLVNSPNHS